MNSQSVVGTTLGVLSVLLNRLWRKERQHKPAFRGVVRFIGGNNRANAVAVRVPYDCGTGVTVGVRRPGFGVGAIDLTPS